MRGHRPRTNPVTRFWSKTVRSGDCILWTGPKNQSGYGRFWVDGRQVCAHRWSWEQVNGPMPAHLQGMHSCDTPSCVNPDHITPGTALENRQDCIAKGRARYRYVAAPYRPSKVNEDIVREIRAMSLAGNFYKTIADRFGISPTLVGHIVRGKAWARAGGHIGSIRGRGRPRKDQLVEEALKTP